MHTIIHHPRTLADLRHQYPDTILISHFFWLAGEGLEKSFKGFLCSVLFQLVDESSTVAAQVCHQICLDKHRPRSHLDWSVSRLMKYVLGALDNSRQHVCLFIDGIDELEVKDDGGLDLESFLAFVIGPRWSQDLSSAASCLASIPNLKLFVSSRSEPNIVRWMNRNPDLQLHTLTSQDIAVMARKTLRPPRGIQSDENLFNCLVEQLCDKAEGVFLWTRLAVIYINRNLQDSNMTGLASFVSSLPSTINELYRGMWTRLPPSERRQFESRVARYLLTVIQVREMCLDEIWSSAVARGPDLMHIVGASNAGVAQSLVDGRWDANLEKCIRAELQAISDNLPVWSAGMLELVPCQPLFWAKYLTADNHPQVLSYLGVENKTVRFFHRSAHDFLREDDEGRKLLGQAEIDVPGLQIKIARAYLGAINVARKGSPALLPSSFLKWLLDPRGTHQLHQTAVAELLQLCEHLWCDGLMGANTLGGVFEC